MTEKQAIAAIRLNHLKANIGNRCYVRHHWDKAWLDPGGTIFGPGPYVKLPVDWLWKEGSKRTSRVVIRVYAPARLRRKLAQALNAEATKPESHQAESAPSSSGG